MSANALAGLRKSALVAFALVPLAANSILCRLALTVPDIDPASFTSVRLLSGALMLWLLLKLPAAGRPRAVAGSWTAAAMLFLYAVCFSYAYIGLHAGVGALILFGAVQLTMILSGLRSGERLHSTQWVGLALALTGLAVLLLPGATAPPLPSALLMTLAGIAWGVYSLLGRGGGNPLASTAGNFMRAVPMTLAVSLAALPWLHLSATGMGLAVLSGAVTSALGYILWYSILPTIKASTAASAQLAVPVITAIAGAVLLAEALTPRLLVASAVVLGGIALAIRARQR